MAESQRPTLSDFEAYCEWFGQQCLAGSDVDLTDLDLTNDQRKVLTCIKRRLAIYRIRLNRPAMYMRANEWRPGQDLLKKYKVIRHLGRGGMGSVFLVERLRDGARLAVKRALPLKAGSRSPAPVTIVDQPKQLQLLAEIMESLRLPPHPHVLTCRYFDIVDSELVLFADHVTGGSLHESIRSGGFYRGTSPASSFMHLAQQTMNGLRHLHQNQLVHQDIKPENVLIDQLEPSLRVRISDFGVSRRIRTTGTGQDTAPLGGLDPRYASPEQIERQADVTPQSDLYNWGLTMIATALGDELWLKAVDGRPALDQSTIEKYLAGGPCRLPADIATPMAQLLASAMASSASDRPTSSNMCIEIDALCDRLIRSSSRWKASDNTARCFGEDRASDRPEIYMDDAAEVFLRQLAGQSSVTAIHDIKMSKAMMMAGLDERDALQEAERQIRETQKRLDEFTLGMPPE